MAAANACPPEDCSGISGYHEFLDVMGNPKHEEHEEMLNSIGGPWDAARFDLSATNARLQRLKA